MAFRDLRLGRKNSPSAPGTRKELRYNMSGGQAHNPCYLESEVERAQIQDLPGVHREFKSSLFETLSQNKQASKQANQKQANE